MTARRIRVALNVFIFSLDLECRVFGSGTPIKFKLEAGLIRKRGPQSTVAHPNILEDLKNPLRAAVAGYLGEQVMLKDLGDESFPGVVKEIRGAVEPLVDSLGVRLAWFTLTPVVH